MSAPALGFERDHSRSGGVSPKEMMLGKSWSCFVILGFTVLGKMKTRRWQKRKQKKHRSQEGPNFEGNFYFKIRRASLHASFFKSFKFILGTFFV